MSIPNSDSFSSTNVEANQGCKPLSLPPCSATAKQVDIELSKVWPKRGFTRGFPEWEIRIAKEAIIELKRKGEDSRLLALIKEGSRCRLKEILKEIEIENPNLF